MRKFALLALVLAGCVNAEQEARAKAAEEARWNSMTPCQKSAELLGNGYLDPFQKQAILIAMQRAGCI